MSHQFNGLAAASLVFLVCYTALLGWLLHGLFTKRLAWKSRWSLLLLHVLIRVASQALGIAFGIIVFDNTGVFIAYLILSNEGYFSLSLAAYRYLMAWQKQYLGENMLELEYHTKEEKKAHRRQVAALIPIIMPWKYGFMDVMHCYLIPANVLIITGGSYLAGTQDAGETTADYNYSLLISKILRGIGTGVFLIVTILFGWCVMRTIRELRSRGERVHTTLKLFCLLSFFLIVRGVIGFLQSVVYRLSYINPSNYTDHGFKTEFTCIEMCLLVLPEFSSAIILSSSYYLNRSAPQAAFAEVDSKAEARGKRTDSFV